MGIVVYCKYGRGRIFFMRESGWLVAIQIVHRSGAIHCSIKSLRSYCSCVNYGEKCQISNCLVCTFVTNSNNDAIFPDPAFGLYVSSHGNYNLPNVTHDGNTIIFNQTRNNSVKAMKFQEFRIWFSVSLRKIEYYGQRGTHCVDVYASFE